MSVTELLDTAKGLETKSFENLFRGLLALRVQRNKAPLLSDSESTLLKKINAPFDDTKWERLKYLDWKLEFGAQTEEGVATVSRSV